MSVSFKELLESYEFASLSSGEHNVFLCRETGKFYWHSEFGDNEEELPVDIDDPAKYVQIPDKRELDLGKPLVTDFAGQFLPGDFDEVRRIFSRKGAYARFKDLLVRRNELERWYEFEAKAEEAALRAWCEANAIELRRDERPER